ncbi:hypothetical protein RFI_13757 [Reticulomyxa filosa]|uniref:Uncharacterized protein n=1 Tax=Reticulomyxa filosa TaxID=46433 RepID=X6NAX3_RETFI|nr:hypothetical protein RFI_13757 [Reticulomyxa filosa]|eukprot:ETO23425.1 hypothetical protein RFI_13757 [Reticulomyxa filosa]
MDTYLELQQLRQSLEIFSTSKNTRHFWANSCLRYLNNFSHLPPKNRPHIPTVGTAFILCKKMGKEVTKKNVFAALEKMNIVGGDIRLKLMFSNVKNALSFVLVNESTQEMWFNPIHERSAVTEVLLEWCLYYDKQLHQLFANEIQEFKKPELSTDVMEAVSKMEHLRDQKNSNVLWCQ